ncbi:sucrase ferredoxin [Catenulispora subtropica]|uniref:Sucrase ferredoxin n=1 Tax=Catenulispora subtropica TaxID=450798 RepID=A0ABN2QMN4_9ACTN
MTGTAATHSAWLLLEQPGPWGRVAARESRLDPQLGAELDGRTAGTGVRLCLIRRPDDRRDHEPPRRRWFAASTHPERTWLATGEIAYPTDLLKVDFPALDAGDRGAVAALDPTFLDTPILGICSNGKRDACCATLGRRVVISAEALDAAACAAAGGPPAVWEITHLGGHKFAPTGVVLPSGYLYGRLDAALATRALAEARRGRVLPERNRGRSTWGRPGQAAELAVRAELDEWATPAVRVRAVEKTAGEPEPAWTVVVEHEDGRAYEVFVQGAHAPVGRPESCGKTEANPLELRVETVEKIG